MTKREAAVISAHTGYLIGSFSDMHDYIKEILNRPVFTHELGNDLIVEEIKEKSKPDFLKILENLEDE